MHQNNLYMTIIFNFGKKLGSFNGILKKDTLKVEET